MVLQTSHTPEVVRKEPIVKSQIVDQPVVEEVIEHKTVEVHHKPVIIEIHEQPIIEVERKAQTRYVNDDIEVRHISHDYQMEDPNEVLTEAERKMVEGLITKSTTTVKELEVREGVKHSIVEDVIEIHDAPIVCPVHSYPVTRYEPSTKVVETIEETTTTIPTTIAENFKSSSTHFGEGQLHKIVSGGNDHIWAILEDGSVYRMHNRKHYDEVWSRIDPMIVQAFDLAVTSDGHLFFIGFTDRLLYRLREQGKEYIVERVVPLEPIRLMNITAANENSVYGLTEHGLVIHFINDNIAKMSGKLKMISIGGPVKRMFKSDKYEMWGIGLDNKIWRWNGMNRWVKIEGNDEFIDLCVSKDLHVYAVRTDGLLMSWNAERKGFETQKLEGALGIQFKSITTYKAGSNVFGVDHNGNILHLAAE
jgi:hypothetical protein